MASSVTQAAAEEEAAAAEELPSSSERRRFEPRCIVLLVTTAEELLGPGASVVTRCSVGLPLLVVAKVKVFVKIFVRFGVGRGEHAQPLAGVERVHSFHSDENIIVCRQA